MNDNTNQPKLYSVKEAAEILGVSSSSVRKWSNLSELATVYDKETGNRMFSKQELIRFKVQLDNEASDLSLVGFGIDKLNKFSKSIQGKILKYTFVIFFILINTLGIYTIINLQKENSTLKQQSNDIYKVVGVDPTSIDDSIGDRQTNLINGSAEKINKSKIYGKLVIDVDDELINLLGKSLSTTEPITLGNTKLNQLSENIIKPIFFSSNNTNVSDKVSMKDTITGKVYCILVSNGKLVTLNGYCGE